MIAIKILIHIKHI